MTLYESCKVAIIVSFLGFAFIAFGFLIQNENVNLFYTITNSFVLFLSELFLKIGQAIIMNLPLIFMVNIACKKANSGSPVIVAIIGYFAYLVTTMLFADQTLGNQAYVSTYGINSILNVVSGNRYPLETGLIGSLLVGFATRISFIHSRHRSAFSFLTFFNKDSAAVLFNILLCVLAGIGVSYLFPMFYNLIQKLIVYISGDLMDSTRIGFFSAADRFLSTLGLGNIIKQPFWFTALGGSYSTVAGQSVLGDVNIWNYISDASSSYAGCGRFITPYYVINMFMVPGIYLGILFSMSDKKARRKYYLPFACAIILSVIAGNPLPVELLMLFTSPLLYILYIVCVGITSGALVNYNVFLGYATTNTNTVIAMPGSFPDYIVNLRNPVLYDSVMGILFIGLVAGVVCFIITMIYYRLLAFDFARIGRAEKMADNIIDAVGGLDNVVDSGSCLFKVNVSLNNLEDMNYEKLKELGVRRITETKSGLSLELGTSCHIIASKIKKIIKNAHKAITA